MLKDTSSVPTTPIFLSSPYWDHMIGRSCKNLSDNYKIVEHICTWWEIVVKFLLSPLWCVTLSVTVPQRILFSVSHLYTYYIFTHFSAPTEPLAVSTPFNLISIHSLICLRPQQKLAYKPGCWLEFLLAGLDDEGRTDELLVLLPQAHSSSCPWGYRRLTEGNSI
jgi:hypothetical protein